MIAGGVDKVLLEAEISFGSLDGGMSQRKLDLLERGVALVREFGKGPAQVVRGDADAEFLAVALHHFEDRLRGHACAGELARFVHRAA